MQFFTLRGLFAAQDSVEHSAKAENIRPMGN